MKDGIIIKKNKKNSHLLIKHFQIKIHLLINLDHSEAFIGLETPIFCVDLSVLIKFVRLREKPTNHHHLHFVQKIALGSAEVLN